MDNPPLPLHLCRVVKTDMIINRAYMLVLACALLALFYYRVTNLLHIVKTREIPVVPYVLICVTEALFSFLWVLHQAFRWRPVDRTVYPQRLPEDKHLPPVDVFICTADPGKEPAFGVMNTVISAMALDYPPDKIAVYLSDDGGSSVTLQAIEEAWKFAKWWLPFCKKYKVKTRCPQAYFSAGDNRDNDEFIGSSEYVADKKEIEKRYCEFHKNLEKNSVNAGGSVSRDHAPIIKMMPDAVDSAGKEMPILVYVAREKRLSIPHNSKAGALNALMRVSGIISNAPYMLILDCDHYCNDPTSTRQAMCFYLDPKISPELAFVQFPQKFHNLSAYDIYDAQLCYYKRRWYGFDGLQGPSIAGCNLYLKREALYGIKDNKKGVDLNRLKECFGSSNELIKSIDGHYRPGLSKERKVTSTVEKEVKLLASCGYENESQWGKEVGFIYFSVVEDAITAKTLHEHGWTSVLVDPPQPCFLGSSPISLSDVLVQRARWGLGLMQISLSKYSGLFLGRGRISALQSICYAALMHDPIYAIPFYGISIVPQICLVYGVPLYPKVSDPFFAVFVFIFIASQLKHVQEIVSLGSPIATSLYELRIWMMTSASSYLYAIIGTVMDRVGLQEAHFTLTNKVVDGEQVKRYAAGVYDFQATPGLIIPICSLYILNVAALVVGLGKIISKGQNGDEFFVQVFVALFGIVVNYQLGEGMVLRKDRGGISHSVSVVSAAVAVFVLCSGFLLLLY